MKRGVRRIPLAASIFMAATGLIAGWALLGGEGQTAYAFDGGPHAGTFRTWATGASAISGFDPHETIDDVSGLTGQVGSPAMVTSAENTCGGFCGPIYWNPMTNAFKTYCVTGGFQFAGDLNRGTPAPSGSPTGTFGGGDTWFNVRFNSGFSPYMNFAGTGSFRRWDVGASSSTGVHVNSANGKVYLGNEFFDFSTFTTVGQIIELDPITNAVRKWTTGNSPYNLALDTSGRVYATAFAGGGFPDQILRLDPGTNELKRWTIPGGGLQGFVGFGIANGITIDPEGNIWFTESASNEVGRLRGGPDSTIGTADDVIDEWTKPGVIDPQDIAASGSGATLQAFFTETAGGQAVSVLTVAASTPTTTPVAPSAATVTPDVSTATPVDFTPTMLSTTITPVVTPVTSSDPSGIDRFPVPPGTSNPTGMTGVAFPNTVFGSMEGSDHVFEFVSSIIIAPPPGAVEGRMTGGGSVFTGASGTPPGVRVTHGFELHCDAAQGPNNLQVNWGKGNNFHLQALTSATCSLDTSIAGPNPPAAGFNKYVGAGTGFCNGAPATATWTFTDAGEPGRNDTATINIAGGCSLSVSGNLNSGNHQAHAQ